MLEVECDDFNAQEVEHVVASRLDGEVEVEKFVERDRDRRYEIDEHSTQLALRRRVKSQIHRNAVAPAEQMTFTQRPIYLQCRSAWSIRTD